MRDKKENLGLKKKTEILRMVCQLKEKYCEKKF